MAGAEPSDVPAVVDTTASRLSTYGFAMSNGDRLFTLWDDVAATDFDPGQASTILFPGLSASSVVGIDVLDGFEQELRFMNTPDGVVLRDVLVKDYPLIIRIKP